MSLNGIVALIRDAEQHAMTNEERSKAEVEAWLAMKPERYFAYIRESDKTMRTWTGEVLGTVAFGHVWRDNFGGTRQTIMVKGTNGCWYHGTYFKSAGNYCRIKRLKGSKMNDPHTPTDELLFDQWMMHVDFWCQRNHGVNVYDLPDCPFRDWYEDGVKPRTAAKRAVRLAKE